VHEEDRPEASDEDVTADGEDSEDDDEATKLDFPDDRENLAVLEAIRERQGRTDGVSLPDIA